MVETLVFCSGKIYYEIMDGKEATLAVADSKARAESVGVVRVEQLYPFPQHKIEPILKSYPNLKRIVWAQEEPKNMGAWTFIFPQFLEMIQGMELPIPIIYNGRSARASTAAGSEKVHKIEQAEIVARCFDAGTPAPQSKAKVKK